MLDPSIRSKFLTYLHQKGFMVPLDSSSLTICNVYRKHIGIQPIPKRRRSYAVAEKYIRKVAESQSIGRTERPKKKERKNPSNRNPRRTAEWTKLRYEVISKRGNQCECCGAGPRDGVKITVDHIKPISKYPELSFDQNNLQVLCEDCNAGKGNDDETDWRISRDYLMDEYRAIMSDRIIFHICCFFSSSRPRVKMVPSAGLEPANPHYKCGVLPLELTGHFIVYSPRLKF